MIAKRILTLLFLSFPVIHLAGQDISEKNFTRYTTADGLSHNVTTDIVQDSTGYIWITTAAGLNRYDGSRFIQFHSTNDSLSLAAEELSGISWIDKQRFVVRPTAMHIVNTLTGKTTNLFVPYFDKQYQYKFNMIEKVMGDALGNLYVLSRSGFYQFDKNYRLVSRFDFYTQQQVFTEHFSFGRDLYEIDANRLLIISINGLYVYDKIKKHVKKMVAGDCPLLDEFLDYANSGHETYRFLQPRPGQFFVLKRDTDSLVYISIPEKKKTVSILPFEKIGTEFHYRTKLIRLSDTTFFLTGQMSGFYKMNFYSKTGAVQLLPEKYFPSYVCYSILKDMDNNLWIATNKGVFHEDEARSCVEIASIPESMDDSFPNIALDDIYVAADKIYAGARGKSGLMVFDKKTMKLEKQELFKKYNPNGVSVFTLTAVDPTHIMVGTDGPLVIYDCVTGKGKREWPPGYNADNDWVNDMYKDSKGNIWISSANIYTYNPVTHAYKVMPGYARLLTVPFDIQEDNSGNIWMSGHGIARFNTSSGVFDMVLDSFPFIKMPDKQINALVIDHQNTAWFNTKNNGLVAYDINKKAYRHYTREDGLPDDNVASMMIVGKKIWLACFSGLACMDIETSRIISFGKEDGFPDMPIAKGARFFYDSTSNQLYLCFSKSIVRFNPSEILLKKSSPRVFVENITINGKSEHFLPGNQLTTSWRNSDLMITIGSINFSDGKSQGFAYRIIKDHEVPWQQLGSQPSFSISNLSPGSYRIQVKSFSLNNRWREQVNEINVIVSPPFWQRGWFIFIMTLVALVLFYMMIKWRTWLARKKEMEKTHVQMLNAEYYKNQFELEQISNYFSSSLAEKKTEDEVLWDVAQNLIGRMNYEDCMIYLWNEDKSKMIQKAAFGPKGSPEYISAQVFDAVPGQGVVGYVMATREPVLISDTRKDPRYRIDEMFRLSEVCVPIIHDGELLGIIDSEHHEVDYFKERDLKILTTIATLVGNKLNQLESERSLDIKQEELASINVELAEAQLSALQAQMNPHFVFNALNSIKRMILDGDNKKASRYLSKFALMIRMTLNHSRDLFVTLDENIQYLETYLEMEQLRFDDSFTYKIFTSENLDLSETTIPSLMIQPLVENAIWHGLMHVEDEKKIQIGFVQDDNRITCTIEDNGIGIRQSEKLKAINRPLHHSVGLENLHKRIKIMNEKYDTECCLEITDLQEKDKSKRGTLVVLRFNVINQ